MRPRSSLSGGCGLLQASRDASAPRRVEFGCPAWLTLTISRPRSEPRALRHALPEPRCTPGVARVRGRNGRDLARRSIVQHRLRPIDDQPARIFLAHPLFGRLHALGDQLGAVLDAVRMRGNDMNHAIVERSFAPVLGKRPEMTREAPRGDLRPRPAAEDRLEGLVVALGPGEPFGMRDNRDVPRRDEGEDRILEVRRRDVVVRFEQDVASTMPRGRGAGLAAIEALGRGVGVGTACCDGQNGPSLEPTIARSRAR